jgi:transcriptional regulator with XRE-family HTH domain
MEKVNRSDRPNGGDSPLGNLLKTKRESAGLTLTELAEQLSVSRPYLSRLERGEYAHPSPTVLSQMARCLDIGIEDLYAITGYMIPTDLPSFGSYLRAKHPTWPEVASRGLEDFYDFLKQKYTLE